MDGDGLIPRASRPQSWDKTLSLLEEEAARAKTPAEFGRVLHRFDATIPNQHVRGYMPVVLEPYTSPLFPFTARPDEISGESGARDWRIAAVSTAAWSGRGQDAPAPGDEVLSVDGRPMRAWSDENFVFCKLPLRSQCERELFENLEAQRLAWSYPEPLRLGLRRNGREWEAVVPLKYPVSWPKPPDDGAREPLCGVEPGRYPGFEPAYVGFHACVFKSSAHPGVYVLRIASFGYEHDPVEDIDSIQKETRHLYEGFWKNASADVRTLIVDVIDNHGGNEPTGYYRLLFGAPFQEQYVQYRKLAELEGDGARARGLWDSALWGETGKENWLAGLRRDGRWDKVPTGGFLPPVPQFCADDADCERALFTPLPHGFKGRVELLMNRWCVSACVGFAYDLVDVLKGRVETVGEPDSGDSTYSRLFLDVILDPANPRGFRTRLSPFRESGLRDLAGVFYRQIVSVTRSTDARGRVISSLPQRVDVPVPARWDRSDEEWARDAFAAALSRAER